MTPRDLRNIHTTGNTMHRHVTKPAPVFFLADEEPFWLLLPSVMYLISGGAVQPENIYSCILKVTGQV